MRNRNIKGIVILSVALFAMSANADDAARPAARPTALRTADGWGCDTRFARPLGEVLADVARRFHVKLRYDIDTAGLMLPYADARVRPYSVEETLTNILSYFDYKWEARGRNTYKLSRYEYYRRKDADGEKLMAYITSLTPDSATFVARRTRLLQEFRDCVGIDYLLARCVARKAGGTLPDGGGAGVTGSRNAAVSPVREGKIVKRDGYTLRNFALETLPGLYVCGTVYAPRGGQRLRPLILCPNGHFADGRYNPDLQRRMATLARMGAVVVGWDLFGWGESEMQVGREAHTLAVAQPLQLMNGLLILDWMLARGGVDTSRIAVNGGSGGGTHCVMLTLLDSRFTAACPVVSFCSHFDGGCPCESGMGTALCGGGTCNAEYAALFAPRPLACVSDGGDWTHTVPTLEFPYLQRVYGYFHAADRVTNYHYPDDRHDFGPNKRTATYDFFARTFGLDSTAIDEARVTIEEAAALQTFGSADRLPAGAVRSVTDFRALLNE